MYLSPTGKLDVRGPDLWARSGGYFGASRIHKGRDSIHKGLDLIIPPGRDIVASGYGIYHRTGICYSGDLRYLKCVFIFDVTVRMNILYMWPRLIKGTKFKRGDVIGTVQDLSARYPKIINHVHVEVVVRGRRVDPMRYLEVA